MNQETTNKKDGHTCPWWLLFTFDNPLRKLLHDPEKILEPYVKRGITVMDIGCGMGFFSLHLAKLVGEEGKVIAVDLQAQMLAGLRRRAERVRLIERIQIHQSTPEQIGICNTLDFVLAFWMVHEVRQPESFLSQIYELLKPGGKFMLVEPVFHVSERAFEETLSLAKTMGFQAAVRPKLRVSRSVVFNKSGV